MIDEAINEIDITVDEFISLITSGNYELVVRCDENNNTQEMKDNRTITYELVLKEKE